MKHVQHVREQLRHREESSSRSGLLQLLLILLAQLGWQLLRHVLEELLDRM